MTPSFWPPFIPPHPPGGSLLAGNPLRGRKLRWHPGRGESPVREAEALRVAVFDWQGFLPVNNILTASPCCRSAARKGRVRN